MTCLGVLERGERGDDNETSLKEGGLIEMSTTVLPLRDARSLRFVFYLPCLRQNYNVWYLLYYFLTMHWNILNIWFFLLLSKWHSFLWYVPCVLNALHCSLFVESVHWVWHSVQQNQYLLYLVPLVDCLRTYKNQNSERIEQM